MVKIGDILHCSWGATMRLHDFYQVVGFTDKSLKVRELRKTNRGGDCFRPYVWPIKDDFASGILTKRIKTTQPSKWNPNIQPEDYIKITPYQFCYLHPFDETRDYQEDHMD